MDYLYSISFDRDFLAKKALDKTAYTDCREFVASLPPKDADQLLFFDGIFTRKFSSYLDACYPFSKTNMRYYSTGHTEGPFLRMSSTEYDSEMGKKSIKKWLYMTGIPFSTLFLVEGTRFSMMIPFKLYIRHFLLIDWFMSDARAIDLAQRFLFIINHEKGLSFASIIPDKLNDEERWQQYLKLNDGLEP